MTAPLPHERPAIGAAAERAAALAAHIPVIETARLRMRAPRIEDFQAYAAIVEGPSGQFLVETPDREGAWLDFAQMTATWVLRGHGLWAVDTLADETLVGFALIGFEPGDHEPELGYMFLPESTGRGYATEAAEAARAFAFDTLQFPTLVSCVDHENTASRALAERLGGRRDTAAEAAHDNITLVYRYDRKDAA